MHFDQQPPTERITTVRVQIFLLGAVEARRKSADVVDERAFKPVNARYQVGVVRSQLLSQVELHAVFERLVAYEYACLLPDQVFVCRVLRGFRRVVVARGV
ncbi:hypothetical protein D3C87_1784740 [compost metagenome]